jgi:hypothetical protein
VTIYSPSLGGNLPRIIIIDSAVTGRDHAEDLEEVYYRASFRAKLVRLLKGLIDQYSVTDALEAVVSATPSKPRM